MTTTQTRPAGRTWSLSLAPDAPLRHGETVEILVGGYRGDTATVRSLWNDYMSLTHSSGCILSGFHVSEVRRVKS